MTLEMTEPMGTADENEETRGTPQGVADSQASGAGGTPPGGHGPSRSEVAKKAPGTRRAGLGSKQPTKRKAVKQKAKRAAAAKSPDTRAGTGGARAGARAGSARPAAKKATGARKSAAKTGAAAARKSAATKASIQKRAAKTGATRRRLHQRH